MAKNKQLIASLVVADRDTGQEKRSEEKIKNFPETISFRKNFCKVHHAVYLNMTDSQIGKFVRLTRHLDYWSNRLVSRSRGRIPIPLDQVMISHILEKSIRTTNTFMGEMKAIKAIMKIDTDYHMSPRFASRSWSLNTDIIIKMIKKDPLIIKAMGSRQWDRLKDFI
jgi:hypothetical protein